MQECPSCRKKSTLFQNFKVNIVIKNISNLVELKIDDEYKDEYKPEQMKTDEMKEDEKPTLFQRAKKFNQLLLNCIILGINSVVIFYFIFKIKQ